MNRLQIIIKPNTKNLFPSELEKLYDMKCIGFQLSGDPSKPGLWIFKTNLTGAKVYIPEAVWSATKLPKFLKRQAI